MLSAIDRNHCPQSIGTPVRNRRNPQLLRKQLLVALILDAEGSAAIRHRPPGRLVVLYPSLDESWGSCQVKIAIEAVRPNMAIAGLTVEFCNAACRYWSEF
jgi:hypothetical protein